MILLSGERKLDCNVGETIQAGGRYGILSFVAYTIVIGKHFMISDHLIVHIIIMLILGAMPKALQCQAVVPFLYGYGLWPLIPKIDRMRWLFLKFDRAT